MSGGFATEVVRDGDETVIYLSGEVDVMACQRLRDTLEPHLGPRQSIVLDLSQVEFMDSSSLRVLIQARSTLTADGGSLVLRNPSKKARRLLNVAAVEHLLRLDAQEHPPGTD